MIRVLEAIAKLIWDPNLHFLHRIRIFRKLPMTSRICQLAKNRTGTKIIKFGLQSSFAIASRLQGVDFFVF